VGGRIWEQCVEKDVGKWSKSQLVSGDWERSLETASVITQVKDDKFSGVNREGKWGEVEIRLISKLVWIELVNLVREEVSKRLTQET